MNTLKTVFLMASIAMVCFLPSAPAAADPGDTTIVITFDEEFINWATPHVMTFEFPDTNLQFTEIWLTIVIGCPGAPGDCDPWDRLGHLSVIQEHDSVSERYEIARFITPYDITGFNMPGTCPWWFDLTDYQTLLKDSVTLSLYIESWIGGDRGWLITATFEMIEGFPAMEPYQVINLWNKSRVVYGDTSRPVEEQLPPVAKFVDADADSMMLRVTTTGHGQGNTDNAAEFSNKWHGAWAGETYFEHQLWRSNCNVNPCSPQGGTWQYNRAGWCPGAGVIPWDNTVDTFTPGDSMVFQYVIEPYENYCRPNNPDCVDGQTCPDCDYNYTGHTEPHYTTMGQIILYRVGESAAEPKQNAGVPDGLVLEQNYPNPFNPTATIRFSLPMSGYARLIVYNLAGKEVARLVDNSLNAGSHTVTFDGVHLASGVYFYRLELNDFGITKKMLLLK